MAEEQTAGAPVEETAQPTPQQQPIEQELEVEKPKTDSNPVEEDSATKSNEERLAYLEKLLKTQSEISKIAQSYSDNSEIQKLALSASADQRSLDHFKDEVIQTLSSQVKGLQEKSAQQVESHQKEIQAIIDKNKIDDGIRLFPSANEDDSRIKELYVAYENETDPFERSKIRNELIKGK